LLRNGADPELRDEDGKTPADKARERHDEGHREVLEILQSPSEKTLTLVYGSFFLFFEFFTLKWTRHF
jgi:hypothetical protein